MQKCMLYFFLITPDISLPMLLFSITLMSTSNLEQLKSLRRSVLLMSLLEYDGMKQLDQSSTTEGGLYMGALFFAVVMLMFNGLAELAMTIAKLPVFYKQRDLLFYPSWSYALPSWIFVL